MSGPAIVVVGPTAVLGPGEVDPELAAVALDCIDDDLALVDHRPMRVDQMWTELLGSAIGSTSDGVVLVCPSWWPDTRVASVEVAARHWSADVAVRRRAEVLAADRAVVEIAKEIVVVHAAGRRHAVARTGDPKRVLDATVACLDGLVAVTIDVPTTAARFGTDLGLELRRRGIDVSTCGDHEVAGVVRGQGAAPTPRQVRRRSPSPRAVVSVGAALVVAMLGVAALRIVPETSPDVGWLIEGRVAVEVPRGWPVERITVGPGSARVQVISPAAASDALHVTQSRVRDATLAATAEALRVALAGEPGGVFVDFVAAGRRADRPAVTYREVRPDREVSWAVLLDRGVRIAIGCQGAVDTTGVCDRAIGSARAIG
ncbi:MAG: type VII secretion-associated protein [Mycobacterium sp.]